MSKMYDRGFPPALRHSAPDTGAEGIDRESGGDISSPPEAPPSPTEPSPLQQPTPPGNQHTEEDVPLVTLPADAETGEVWGDEPGMTQEAVLTPGQDTPLPVSAGPQRVVGLPAFVWVILTVLLAVLCVLTTTLFLRGKKLARKAKGMETSAPVTRMPTRLPSPATGNKPSSLAIGNLHNVGKRGNQEDSFAISDVSNAALLRRHGLLAVVADGMGGLENGEAVSAAVSSTMIHLLSELPDTLTQSQKLLWLCEQANREACRVSGGEAGQCGSTLVATLVRDDQLWFVSVGDSRICLFRDGAPIQLTREHVYAAELEARAARGDIGFDEAALDKQRHALTSYMGMPAPEHVDFNLRPIQLLSGDWIVLMSDGVFNTLSDEEIAAQLQGNVHDVASRIEESVLRRQSAYQDNFTAILLKIS